VVLAEAEADAHDTASVPGVDRSVGLDQVPFASVATYPLSKTTAQSAPAPAHATCDGVPNPPGGVTLDQFPWS
jgi:hypothetical protein